MDKEKNSSENINQSHPTNAKQTTGQESNRLKPIAIVDTKLSDFVDWLKTISVFKLTVVLSEVAILSGAVSYIVTIPNRQQQEIQQAREVLHEQSKNKYSNARITALEVLDKHCQGNPGLKAPKGKMPELKLYRCRKFSFQNWSLKIKKRGMDLSNSSLKEADLSGADLQGINLRGSDLQNADLTGANLEGADLTGAELQSANLSRANLKGAILKNSKLNKSNLYGANFENADFSKAELQGTTAEWANFNHANFYRANLQSANFNRTQLMGADFYWADLKNSKLRFADLSRNTNKQGKQLTISANLREADLKGADLWGTKFWSDFQLKRAKNWKQSTLMPSWEQQIIQPRLPRLRIAILKPKAQQSIFDAYELGMRRAAERRVEIWAIDYDDAKDQAEKIKDLVNEGMDGIILTPEDPTESYKALKEASKAGVAITTVDFCFERSKAEDLAIACYDTDKFKMGRESGQELVKWAKNNIRANSDSQEEIVEVALIDGVYERYYPYLKGVLKSINESDVVKIKDSVGVASGEDIEKVKQLLKDNPKAKILWGGSNLATEVAINAVTELEKKEVKVFGIVDLSMDKADKLFDDNSPLQLIIDQYRHQVGYKAVKRTIDVLRGECSGADYKEIIIEHRPLTNLSDIREVREEELISEPQDFEKVSKKLGFRDCKPVSK